MPSAHLKKFASVKAAQIEWRNGLPFSTEFNDVYFSVHGAIEESQHVFIDGNRLNHDWKNTNQMQFYIAELGFGSGLNFFNTARHWKQHLDRTNNTQHLHYVAIEKRPFSITDFKKAALLWPQLFEFSQALLHNYPSQTYGRHQIYFKQWNLTLTLFLMPIENALDDLTKESNHHQNKIQFDHWYLDGFSPTKNTSMWGEENAKKIAKLSKVGTRLATYSVAGVIKRPLNEVGFKLSKPKGFAKKREMLTGILTTPFNDQAPSKFINLKYESPWFNIKQTHIHPPTRENKIAIIGGGIAGCTTAYTLTQKGYRCDLFESNSNIAQGASGAAAGIFHPQLTSDMNIGSQYNWQAYLRLLHFLAGLTEGEKYQVILSQGIERFLKNESVAKNLIHLSKNLAINDWVKESQLFLNNNRCVTFPDAATIDMAAFCKLLLKKIPDVQLSFKKQTEILELCFEDDQWILYGNNEQHHYSQVIFCGGAKSPLLDKLNISTANISRGQTCYFQSDKLAINIKNTLMESIYLVPRKNNFFQLGTTFEDFEDNSLNQNSQTNMLSRASKFLKELNLPYLTPDEIDGIQLKGTLGYRLHSSDRMPLVGPAIDTKKLLNNFNKLGQLRLTRDTISDYNLPGLWINTAYGSHGLLYSLLASEHITSLITGDISPLQSQLSNALHPVRFLIKSLKEK